MYALAELPLPSEIVYETVQVMRGEAVAMVIIIGPLLEMVHPDAAPTLVTDSASPSGSLS